MEWNKVFRCCFRSRKKAADLDFQHKNAFAQNFMLNKNDC